MLLIPHPHTRAHTYAHSAKWGVLNWFWCLSSTLNLILNFLPCFIFVFCRKTNKIWIVDFNKHLYFNMDWLIFLNCGSSLVFDSSFEDRMAMGENKLTTGFKPQDFMTFYVNDLKHAGIYLVSGSWFISRKTNMNYWFGLLKHINYASILYDNTPCHPQPKYSKLSLTNKY